MTEKRFQINAAYSKSLHELIGVIRDDDEDMYITDVVDLLNNLSDENEQLKSKIDHLEKKIQRERTSTMKQHEKWEEEIQKENKQLESDLKDCKKLKSKRLNKIRNHRAVIEDLGGSIRAYKGKLGQANDKIEKIKEAMEDTGALTKRQLEKILND